MAQRVAAAQGRHAGGAGGARGAAARGADPARVPHGGARRSCVGQVPLHRARRDGAGVGHGVGAAAAALPLPLLPRRAPAPRAAAVPLARRRPAAARRVGRPARVRQPDLALRRHALALAVAAGGAAAPAVRRTRTPHRGEHVRAACHGRRRRPRRASIGRLPARAGGGRLAAGGCWRQRRSRPELRAALDRVGLGRRRRSAQRLLSARRFRRRRGHHAPLAEHPHAQRLLLAIGQAAERLCHVHRRRRPVAASRLPPRHRDAAVGLLIGRGPRRAHGGLGAVAGQRRLRHRSHPTLLWPRAPAACSEQLIRRLFRERHALHRGGAHAEAAPGRGHSRPGGDRGPVWAVCPLVRWPHGGVAARRAVADSPLPARAARRGPARHPRAARRGGHGRGVRRVRDAGGACVARGHPGVQLCHHRGVRHAAPAPAALRGDACRLVGERGGAAASNAPR
mmetsp:Transcript_4717/g.13805  ORF Transcript_4717/g.13805 Transcript_4717/m.13805 type:complete len:453 (-) Transcript_4717:1224-2582(-)